MPADQLAQARSNIHICCLLLSHFGDRTPAALRQVLPHAHGLGLCACVCISWPADSNATNVYLDCQNLMKYRAHFVFYYVPAFALANVAPARDSDHARALGLDQINYAPTITSASSQTASFTYLSHFRSIQCFKMDYFNL